MKSTDENEIYKDFPEHQTVEFPEFTATSGNKCKPKAFRNGDQVFLSGCWDRDPSQEDIFDYEQLLTKYHTVVASTCQAPDKKELVDYLRDGSLPYWIKQKEMN